MALFELDYEQIKKLEETIKALPGKSEKTINEVLHSKGVEVAKGDITNLLPVSKYKNGKERNKRHAKYSQPFNDFKFNLGFVVEVKGKTSIPSSFGYLFFPECGFGKHNPVAQDFMENGLEKATPKILDEVQKGLIEEIEEELYK